MSGILPPGPTGRWRSTLRLIRDPRHRQLVGKSKFSTVDLMIGSFQNCRPWIDVGLQPLVGPVRSPRRFRLPKMTDMEKLDYTVDTSKEAREVQLACLRQMSPCERMRQTLAMSRRVRNMAMDAIRRRHPDLDDAEVGLIFIDLTYGKSIADAIRRWRAEQAS